MARPSSDDDAPLEAAFAAARGEDDPGRLLARARVAAQLFGRAAAGLGRFHVLERLGEGGMGVVYAAYDPELDRGVALKMVRVASRSRELALREAKALAQLSHPNIVPVFDVGFESEHVYIVMELVRGATLRAWTKQHAPAAVIEAYRQVAAGLAAAHDAGIVHRDFKPDNALVGDDGRVRIVDFGLAAAIASEGSTAGTPGYMAPEQAAGGPVTTATDQYSVCVALREALPEPPKWIAELIERGTALAPADRFASMHELARALTRDPSRVRRRRLAVAAVLVGAVAASAVAFAVGRRASAETCEGAAGALETAWAPASEQAALARIAKLSPYGAELASRLSQALDVHARAWIASQRDACVAHRRGDQSDALFDRRVACLDRSRAGRAALGELAEAARLDNLSELARAAAAVPPPAACDDVTTLVAEVAPPSLAIRAQVESARRELERARVQLAAGKFELARSTAETVADEARMLDYAPLRAEANLVVGHAMMQLGDRGAVNRLGEVVTLAIAENLDAIAVEAWARRAYLRGIRSTPEDALAGVELATALAARTGSAFARGLLANNVGNVEVARGDRAAARRDFERAVVAAGEVRGYHAIELANARANLALVTDDPAKREELMRGVEAQLASLLGPTHPDVLLATWNRVMMTAPPEAARVELAALCASDEQHRELALRTATCWAELADLHAVNGDRETAAHLLARAIELGAETSSSLPEVAGYALLWRDDRIGAASAFRRELSARSATASWWETFVRAKLELALARTGDTEAKKRAIELFGSLVPEHPMAAIQRRLAEARAL